MCPDCGCRYTEEDGCDYAHWRIPSAQDIQRNWAAANESGNDDAADAWSYLMNAWREISHLLGDIKELQRRRGTTAVNIGPLDEYRGQ